MLSYDMIVITSGKVKGDSLMKKVILTGFEPFLNHEANPSELIVSALDEKVINGLQVKSVVLPVSFQRAAEIMKKINKGRGPSSHCHVRSCRKANGYLVRAYSD